MLRLLYLTLFVLFSLVPAYADMYAVSGGKLYRSTGKDGTFTFRDNTADVRGIAMNKYRTLYGVGSGFFGTINKDNGQFTKIGGNTVGLNGIAFSSDGNLYAVGSGIFGTVNTTTGAFTQRGGWVANLEDLAFTSSDALYGVGDGIFGTINTTTGAFTFISNVPNIDSMSYSSDGYFYASGGGYFGKIDTSGNWTKVTTVNNIDGITFASEDARIPDGFPLGCTFFADYTDGKNGVNADFSIGSPTATYTSTSGTPDLDGGYHATTANADVLKYETSGNRTAATETIVVKFAPSWNGNAAVDNWLTSTDTKARDFWVANVTDKAVWQPNASDSGGVSCDGTSTIVAGTTYVYIGIAQHASPYAQFFVNGGSSEDPYTGGDYTNPAWGNYFYIGVNSTGANQLNGIVKSVAFFNRVLSSDGEIATITNLM